MSDRRSPSDDELRDAYSELGDALQRAVVLSTERVQSALEDAVLRGRMTRRDAEELATSLISVGRDQAAELRNDLDQLARAVAGVVDPRPAKRRERRRRDDAPDPSGMTVKEVHEMLPELGGAALQRLREREAAGKARVTVLRAIDEQIEDAG